MIGSNIGRSSGPKSDRTRRSWSDKEEETLIISMKELVANGWKSDNGFRVGYLKRIEEALLRQNPKTDLKVHPHIWSKITTWKKNYVLLCSILNRSGVGFNENGDYKIVCDEDQWAQIIKSDVNAKYMRGKSWPHFEAWKIIYGKDQLLVEMQRTQLNLLSVFMPHRRTRTWTRRTTTTPTWMEFMLENQLEKRNIRFPLLIVRVTVT
ncbi:hypothetical protein AAHA92_22032 [Salvia divinorum]|uniref:Myb/SANT-like domain-containing protein n=1 Tax=Salvia divinorum TaxID=28513 RepID=A0ABD1GQ95_SALDI